MKSFRIIIASLATTVIMLAGSANAATSGKIVKECTFTRSGTTATVTGTTEPGVLAVAIEVLASSDDSVKVESTAVGEDNTFTYTFSDLGTTAAFNFRVADYAGGDWCVATEVIPEETPTEEDATAPGTGAMPTETASATESSSYIGLAIIVAIAALGFIIFKIVSRKHAKNERQN